MDWQRLERTLARQLGSSFSIRGQRDIGGGCINQAWQLETSEGPLFLKYHPSAGSTLFEAEFAALETIADTGTVRVPRPRACGGDTNTGWLLLEYIDLYPPNARCAERLGRQLADLHRVEAPRFGFQGHNFIGRTPQYNDWQRDWRDFFRDQRLAPQRHLAGEQGAPAPLLAALEQVIDAVDGLLEDHHPAPALLHGDLWGGNWASDGTGNPVLFDPASYYGDPEADLAMTELFGGFDPAFYRAYRAAMPLSAGYEQRRTLYNLYHVLNHFSLFGGGYAGQALRMCEALLNGA